MSLFSTVLTKKVLKVKVLPICIQKPVDSGSVGQISIDFIAALWYNFI